LLFIEQLLNNETFENYLGLNQGIAYLFSPTLKGKRHEGSMNDIINNCLNKEVIVTRLENCADSPLLIINSENERAFICSSVSNKLNQELIAERIKVNNLTVSII
jgi:hypothetical protein